MPKPADWDKVRVRWEAGEDLSQLSRATGRPKLVIEAEAKVRKWRSDRRPTITHAHARSETKSASIVLRERVPTSSDRVTLDFDPSESLDAAAAAAQHMADYQALRTVAMQYLGQIGSFQDQVIPKVMTSIAGALKVVQDGQRKTLRMDANQAKDVGTLEDAMAEINGRSGIITIISSDGQEPLTASPDPDDA